MATKHSSNKFFYLFETWKLVKQHAEHHLIGLRWKIGQEQNLVGRSIVNTSSLNTVMEMGFQIYPSFYLVILTLNLQSLAIKSKNYDIDTENFLIEHQVEGLRVKTVNLLTRHLQK